MDEGRRKKPLEEMARGPFAFQWSVPLDGFRWDAGLTPARDVFLNPKPVADSGPWLSPNEAIPHATGRGASYAARLYAPLAKPGLFRRFGALPTTPKAIQRFADKYGMLTGGVWLALVDSEPPRFYIAGEPVRISLIGESFRLWQEEIEHMAMLLELWRLIEGEQAGRLGQHIQWHQLPTGRYVGFDWTFPNGARLEEPIATDFRGDTYAINQWLPGSVVEPARYHLHSQINGHLKGHVSPAVLPFRNSSIYLFPDSLLSAMYVQFAQELSAPRQVPRICKGCGEYFDPKDARQRYCDARCKRTAWYHRHKNDEKGDSDEQTRSE